MTITTKPTIGRFSTILATALLAAGALTACSSGSDTPDSGESTTSAENRVRENMLATAKCLRDKGFNVSDQDMADGKLAVPDGADADAYMKAMAECSPKNPGTGQAQGPATPLGFDAKVATCLRGAGFTDFPDDPGSQGEYVPQDEDGFSEALDKCVAEHGDGSRMKAPRG